MNLPMKYHLVKTSKKMRSKFIPALFFFSIFIIHLFAQQGIPLAPNPAKLVNDCANLLSQEQKNYLEQKLVSFDDTTGNQIAIVIVNDLAGYDRSEFAFAIINKWGIGGARNNGVLILVKPKIGQEQGIVFIAPGLGLEPVIPDLTAKQIIENEMIPHLRNNDYFTALNNASDILMGLAAQEFSAADYEGRVASEPHPLLNFLPLIFILLFYFVISKAKTKNASLGHGTSIWTLLMLMNASGRSHSGSFGNFSGGRGGIGGGGFGGFGGGRSGGGGAGGSW
jgi:uncharacterized protein